MNTVSLQIEKLLQNLKEQKNVFPETDQTDNPTIQVNKLTGKMGVFYEKIRYLVDYQEEHTIRRNAIERILKRKLLFENKDYDQIGLELLEELVSGGYLPNNTILEKVSSDVQKIINKFALLENKMREKEKVETSSVRILNSLTASEIDAFLNPVILDELVVEAFYEVIKERIKFSQSIAFISNEELNLQIYVACKRSLLKNDDNTLSYALWLKFIPGWLNDLEEKDIDEIAEHFALFQEAINAHLKHPLSWRILPKLKNYSIYFSLIKEIIGKYGAMSENIFSNPEHLDHNIKILLENKYKTENAKTQQGSVRAVIYIFLTKILLAFIFEWPYDLLWGSVNYMALAINVLFHPTLLFIVTKSIKPLGLQNTSNVIAGMHEVLYGRNVKAIYIPKKTSGFFNSAFMFFYTLMFIGVFGFIIWGLHLLHFNIVSIALFILFLTLISYFGLRIRHNAQNWRVESEEEGVLGLLWNIFTLPIVRMGRWLSRKFSAINIFVFILDFIIETPFKMLLKFSDAFLSFLKEKKQEIY